MSAAKHTPGPWHRDRASGLACDVRAAGGKKIALCFGFSEPRKLKGETATAYRARFERYRAQCDVNAVLIATAPEMFDLLVKLRDEGEVSNDALIAVLAKATGSAS